MGSALSTARKSNGATGTSSVVDDLVETAPEPDIAISQQLDTATKSQHVVSSSSLVKESPTTNPEKSLSEATNELSDEQKIDSTISHCVAEELTMVTEPGNNLGYVVLVEGINESEVEVPVAPESENIQLQQSTQGNSLVFPTDPDLTHWVHINDWDERRHWFKQGDLVEFYRGNGLYNHWGVYMGNGCVAHVTTFNLMTSSTSFLKAINVAGLFFPSVTKHPLATAITAGTSICIQLGEMILQPSPPPDPGNSDLYYYRMDPIVVVAGTDQFRVNNLANRAKDHIARTWEETFKLIYERINTVHEYSLLRNNCEHIATFFRYKPKDGAKKPRTK